MWTEVPALRSSLTTRRTFLRSSLVTLAMAQRFTPRFLRGRAQSTEFATSHSAKRRDDKRLDPSDLRALAMRALDVARASGASYADVRFTRTQRRVMSADPLQDSLDIAVGVRALVGGAWGFAATTDWTPDAITRISRMAASQAKASIWPGVPPITFLDHIPVAVGEWHTPIQRDPFTVPEDEVQAFLDRIVAVAGTLRPAGFYAIAPVFRFERQARTFASTTDAFTTQVISTAFGAHPHTTDGVPSGLIIFGKGKTGGIGEYHVPAVSPVGAGYEVLDALGIIEHLPEWVECAVRLGDAQPFQALGAYDVVFDGHAMAAIVNGTCGVALEYDRAVGYEANSGGTSYLAPPPKILGSRWAPDTVTILADRTLLGGAATVGWDDDGVTPPPAPLIQDGIVTDYATSREFVSDLAPWYQRRGMPVRSNGCASSETALAIPMIHTPNLVLQPGPAQNNFEALVSGISHGYAVCGGDVTMDFQQRTGYLRGHGAAQVYTVTRGKLGDPVADAVVTFQSSSLWQSLVAVGGPATAAAHGFFSNKGQPNQVAMHTVRAAAARFQNVRVLLPDQV